MQEGSIAHYGPEPLALMPSVGGAGSSVANPLDMYAAFNPHSNPYRDKNRQENEGERGEDTPYFLTNKIVTGNAWSPREGDAAYTQAEQEQERRALEAAFEHSSEFKDTLRYTEGIDALMEHGGSLDGFESGSVEQEAVLAKIRVGLDRSKAHESHASAYERQYSFRRQSPPTNAQLRQIGIYTARRRVWHG